MFFPSECGRLHPYRASRRHRDHRGPDRSRLSRLSRRPEPGQESASQVLTWSKSSPPVTAYYAEYGSILSLRRPPADTTYGATTTNAQLFNELRSVNAIQNPREIVFLSPPDAKDANNPRAGISSASAPRVNTSIPGENRTWFASTPTTIIKSAIPIRRTRGPRPLSEAASSRGHSEKTLCRKALQPRPSDKNAGTNKDDVISWQ